MDIESTSQDSQSPRVALKTVPFLIAVLWLIIFGATFSDLADRWVQWDGALAHGIPVLMIFLGLLWKTGPWSRSHWFDPVLEQLASGVALLGITLLWFLAYAVNIQIIEQLLLLPALILVYSIVFGWKTVFQYRILLLFLIFAIPIWGSLNDTLLAMASEVVGSLVRLAEMPALIQGNSIYIPYGHILIADGCSGLRYFVVALTLAYLIGYLNGYREVSLLVILAIAAFLGLVTNWLRIFILIIIGYKTEMQSSLMTDHELFGWFLFGGIFLPAIYFSPVRRINKVTYDGARVEPFRWSLMGNSLGLMAAGPLLGLFLQWTFDPASEVASHALSDRMSAISTPVAILAPKNSETAVVKLDDGVFLRKDLYHRRQFEDKLVPYLPRLYDNEQWLLVNEQEAKVGSETVVFQILSEKSGNRRVALLQWFDISGQITASRVTAKLAQIPATLKGHNQFTIVTLQTYCQVDTCPNARDRLVDRAKKLIATET